MRYISAISAWSLFTISKRSKICSLISLSTSSATGDDRFGDGEPPNLLPVAGSTVLWKSMKEVLFEGEMEKVLRRSGFFLCYKTCFWTRKFCLTLLLAALALAKLLLCVSRALVLTCVKLLLKISFFLKAWISFYLAFGSFTKASKVWLYSSLKDSSSSCTRVDLLLADIYVF